MLSEILRSLDASEFSADDLTRLQVGSVSDCLNARDKRHIIQYMYLLESHHPNLLGSLIQLPLRVNQSTPTPRRSPSSS